MYVCLNVTFMIAFCLFTGKEKNSLSIPPKFQSIVNKMINFKYYTLKSHLFIMSFTEKILLHPRCG